MPRVTIVPALELMVSAAAACAPRASGVFPCISSLHEHNRRVTDADNTVECAARSPVGRAVPSHDKVYSWIGKAYVVARPSAECAGDCLSLSADRRTRRATNAQVRQIPAAIRRKGGGNAAPVVDARTRSVSRRFSDRPSGCVRMIFLRVSRTQFVLAVLRLLAYRTVPGPDQP